MMYVPNESAVHGAGNIVLESFLVFVIQRQKA